MQTPCNRRCGGSFSPHTRNNEHGAARKGGAFLSLIHLTHASARTTIDMHATTNACSCGNHEPHVIARRKSADGFIVKFWSDGAVTSALGLYIVQGSRGKSLDAAIRAAWRVAENVELYDYREIRALVLRARKEAARAPAKA